MNSKLRYLRRIYLGQNIDWDSLRYYDAFIIYVIIIMANYILNAGGSMNKSN